MPATLWNLYSRRRPARLAASIMVFAASVVVARAQTEEAAGSLQAAATTPYSLFQYSTLTGSGNTITATWLPVVTSTGATIYKNLTIEFNVDSAGNLTVAPGYPQVVAATPPIISSFKAGRYVGPSTILDGNAAINVSGPGVTSGGATEWSLAAGTGASYYIYPASATWYIGPLTSNPLYSRIKAAGITSTAWYYGVGGSSCGCPQWQKGTLMGFSQIGNTLTIVSFTSNDVDKSEPVDQITYTLAP